MLDRIFVNRILNMRHIKYIGLDMDHTLIRYNTEQFESKVYEMMVDYLIEQFNYPIIIKQLEFCFDLAIRGLVIDKANGNILKISRHGGIRLSYHGTQQIDFQLQKKFYRSTYIDLSDDNFKPVDTAFSMAVCVLYAQLVDLKDQGKLSIEGYEKLANDVLYTVDKVHALGELKKYVCKNLEIFVQKDRSLVEGIKRYITHGKKIFIITNSDYEYTKQLLDYAINPFLDKGETWLDLFEYVITLADKPRFFYDKLKFLKIDPETNLMSNLKGKLTPGLYQGGCAITFANELNINGHEILYIGDHIYGDVLRLKKDCNWRTALVVEELGHEIKAQIEAEPYEEIISKLMDQKKPMETAYVDLSSKQIEEQTSKYDKEIKELLDKISDLDREISKQLSNLRQCFNSQWDRVFRAGAEESYFAHQVNRFACIYMEKISDFFNCSPRTYFRVTKRPLPHEL